MECNVGRSVLSSYDFLMEHPLVKPTSPCDPLLLLLIASSSCTTRGMFVDGVFDLTHYGVSILQ